MEAPAASNAMTEIVTIERDRLVARPPCALGGALAGAGSSFEVGFRPCMVLDASVRAGAVRFQSDVRGASLFFHAPTSEGIGPALDYDRDEGAP